MPETTIQCPICGRSTRGRFLRTTVIDGQRFVVCKWCAAECDEKGLTDGGRKVKLSKQPLYEQEPLPF